MTFALAAAGTGTAAVSDPIVIGAECPRRCSRVRPELFAAGKTVAFPGANVHVPTEDSRVGHIE